MDNQYKYFGQSLNKTIARELVMELFKGKTVSKKEIVRQVDEIHIQRGGKKKEGKYHPITNLLSTLKGKKLADNPSLGVWHIIDDGKNTEVDDVNDDNDNGVRRIGSGSGSVYVYYYPTYKLYAELRGEETWPCKIGYSEYADPMDRIYGQTATGMPEEPEIALVMQANRPEDVEKGIHGLLDRLSDAPGTEWFMTNPSKVEKIYNIIIKDYS